MLPGPETGPGRSSDRRDRMRREANMSTMERFNNFLKEVRVEARKVTWPTREELLGVDRGRPGHGRDHLVLHLPGGPGRRATGHHDPLTRRRMREAREESVVRSLRNDNVEEVVCHPYLRRAREQGAGEPGAGHPVREAPGPLRRDPHRDRGFHRDEGPEEDRLAAEDLSVLRAGGDGVGHRDPGPGHGRSRGDPLPR